MTSRNALCTRIKDAYEEKNGILGYRQMTIKLNRENDFHVNEKRILHLMRILQLKSVCRRRKKLCKINTGGHSRKHSYPGILC